ncbi:histidinol-phosphate transaminase [Kordiimonas marina]|uniref:histidinol-phosphate transaminase n=1 Tax=Kordiimonas marina TaxID=2872312 RepID=UPI001FF5E865|nr:histidinol-phosphate transaminase [Kordiimonas marina]MCJ9428400.1 histidinol-phosphate transaminase [Kordiimonas marina]
MTAPKAHAWIDEMKPYVPGKSKAYGHHHPVKLSSNESVYGPSPKAMEAYRAATEGMIRYPDAESAELRAAIAEVHGLDVSRVICGAGSDDILTLLIHSYAGPGDEVIYSQYGFMVYPVQTEAVGATGIAVPNKNWAPDVDGILGAVTERTKLVFIDNPNNPTGTYVPWNEIERLHAGLPKHVLLVLDGAYAECVTAADYQAGAALVERAENVIMTRTFSKMYALAGLRVGWGYGPAAVIDVLNRVRMPFNVSVPAQAAAVAAVKDQDHLKASVAFNAEWRAWETAALSALGLDVVHSEANFLLVGFPTESPFTALECNEYLMKNGYIVRALSVLPDHLRISIGSEQQNRGVIALITDFMNGSPEAGEASDG